MVSTSILWVGGRQWLALSVNALLDLIRQPILLLMTLFGIGFIGLMPVFSVFTLGDEMRLVRDGALATFFIVSACLSSYAAAATLNRELTHGTAAMVLCKPIGRELFYAAKLSGVLILLGFMLLIFLPVILLSERMAMTGIETDWTVGGALYSATGMALVLGALWNYAGKQPFVSSTFLCLLPCLWLALIAAAGVDPLGHGIPFGALISWSTIPVIVLCALAAAVLASAALALSTRLAPVFTLCFCGVFFSLTLLATPLWPASACGAGWVKVLLPNWQLFWMLDVLADRGACPWSYVQLCGVYALAWILAWACLGLASFRHRDIE